MNTSTSPTRTVPVGPYTWPRNDVGFGKQARQARKQARRDHQAARTERRETLRQRRAKTWTAQDSLPAFAARMSLSVRATVAVAVSLSLILGSVLGLAIFVVQSAA